jgi:exosortase A-associated hydrolase 2
MSASSKGAVTPLFLDGPAGKLFGIYYSPVANGRVRGGLVYVPPFAEEMNRARRMAALQARALAALGMGVLLLDLFGTGDSAGDFEDARWPIWLGDIDAAARWVETRGGSPVGLWGLRLGASLAAAAAAREPRRFKRLVLWQPVPDGKSMLTQFLRVRVAAAMGAVSGEKTEDLRARLAKGEPVEIAGYTLAPELASAIDGIRMDALHLASDADVRWFEVAAEKSDRVLPGGQRVIEAWRVSGVSPSATTVAGDPFWALQETTLAPDLLAATMDAVQTCQP